jgi:acetolactate synthase-1/2/3 large subunit
MRVCDIIAEFICNKAGIKDVFMVSGGGVMFLNDGLACNNEIKKICCHHEQAATMAAVAYAKYKGLGCAYVTTGCGGTNSITSVLHAWQDNIPCIFISGQVKRKESSRNCNSSVRQLGVQEADIITIVNSITKYSIMVNDEKEILYHLEKALHIATSGRPGPVWLDIPMDVQSAEVKVDDLIHFDKEELPNKIKVCCGDEDIEYIQKAFKCSKRPIIVAGQGIRLSDSIDQFEKFITKYNIPFVCSRLGFDVLPTEHKLNIGRIGNKGMRSANFALQNSDFVLVLGSRLSVCSTGQEYNYFAREAIVTVVDIDTEEHKKNTVKIDKEINCDLKFFLNTLKLDEELEYSDWADRCLIWKKKYPVFLQEYNNTENGINMYLFVDKLSKYLKEDSVVVTDAGSAAYVPAQGLLFSSRNQRYIVSGAQAEMGFTLPGTIGVCVARNDKETIGITGDGSLQMNIQELQTVVHHGYPIKLFVWNNDGYLSIRTTQNKFFNGRLLGTDSTSGVSFPNLEKISYAYGLAYYKTDSIDNIDTVIQRVFKYDGPVICEVICERDQLIIPNVSSKQLENGELVSSPIEDMYPFLSREEFLSNMIVKPVEE